MVILAVIGLYIWSISRVPTKLELYVFNTKGKPSIFIRTPQDERVLINGGANGDIIRYLTKVIPFYSRRIDTVILTNDITNNVTGLIDIVNRYKIGSVIIPTLTMRDLGSASSTDQIYGAFIDAVNAQGILIKEVTRGDELNFSGLKIEILFPVSVNEFAYSKASGPELVLKISYGSCSFLLIGDASTKIQKFIVQNSSTNTLADSLSSNVLIIPHGASASSLSLDLVNTVRPEFIVYSQSVASGKSTSKKVDPLYMILKDHRFNIQQKNTVKVFSDGESVQIRE
ncbi:MAG: hypothetical protein V4524_01925 [Patescibacteria group bacterium]